MSTSAPTATILIVDDDELALSQISRTLSRSGWRVGTAPTVAAALVWLNFNVPDLLIVSPQIRDTQGQNLIDILSENNRDIPFIVLVGNGEESVVVEMIQRNALDYLIRSQNLLELVPIVVLRGLAQIRREKRRALTKTQLRLVESLLEKCPTAALITSAEEDPKISYFNTRLCTLLGCTPAHFTYVAFSEVEAFTGPWPIFQQARQSGLELTGEFLFHDLRGHQRLVTCDVRPVPDSTGQISHWSITLADITETRFMQNSLRHNRSELAQAQALAHLGNFEIASQRPNAVRSTPEVLRILGHDSLATEMPLSEFVARSVHPDDREYFLQTVQQALDERTGFEIEYRTIRPNGAIRMLKSRTKPILRADGQIAKLAGTLQDLTERRELEQRVLDISEREQRRFGRDLHDGIGQRLTALEMFSHGLLNQLRVQAPALVGSFQELGKQLRETIRETRSLSHGLSPVSLEAEGLLHALRELARSTSTLAGVECRFHCEPAVLISDSNVATHVYRIAQEAVNNALKHAKASQIHITLQEQSDRIELQIRDNGRGLSQTGEANDGVGLRVMKYRAELVNAKLDLRSEPNRGVTITCTLAKRGRQSTLSTSRH